jgi:DNA-binding MarR family transcriptional regulator
MPPPHTVRLTACRAWRMLWPLSAPADVRDRCCPQHRLVYPADMSRIHMMPGHLIRRLHQISVSVFAEQMKTAGVDMTSPQYAALVVIRDNPGMDQATLAGLIAHDRPTIGGVVDRLVAKNLVKRAQNPADRRAKMLSLTDQGRVLLDRLDPLIDDIQHAILPGLTEAEKSEFIRLATKVARAGNNFSRAPLQLPKGAAKSSP